MFTSEIEGERWAIRARTLTKTRLVLDGLEISYRLWETEHGFLIEITLGEETALLCAGGTRVEAELVYGRLVRGGVTPCTAADVWQDLQQGG